MHTLTRDPGVIWRSYYYAGTARIALREDSDVGSEVYYILTDHLGSTSLTYRTSDGMIATQKYKPWGDVRQLVGELPTDYTFQGQRDAGWGLYFFQARWFDSALGRFAQADSIVPGAGNPLAWDRYAGLGNSPVRYTDPSGHMQICADGDEGGGCGSSSPKALLTLPSIDTQEAIRDYIRDHPQYHPEFDPAVREDRIVYSEVAIAMMQVSQEGNSSTLGFGFTGMGGIVGIGRVDRFYATDYEGNSNTFLSYGGGASFPPALFTSVGISITVTNAPTIDKLTGLAVSTGAFVMPSPVGPGSISLEIDKFQDPSNQNIYTGISFSLSWALAVDPMAGYLYTTATNTITFP